RDWSSDVCSSDLRSAPSNNIFSCSVSGYTFGTTAGCPSSPKATKVRNAVAQTDCSAVSNPSLITLINTSIDVLCTYVTKPSMDMESPTFTGCKKSTESVEAVTTDCLACRTAEISATSSICAINFPPNNVPYAFSSGGNICAVFTVLEFELGFFSIINHLL